MILLSLLVASCSFFDDGIIDPSTKIGQTAVTSVTLQKSSLEIKVGQMTPLGVAITPTSAKGTPVTWSYNQDIISIQEISAGAVITGLKEGQTTLIAKCGNQSAACIIKVSGYTQEALQNVEPYITSNQSILQLSKGDTDKLSVSLYNGSAADIDGYSWTVVDNQNVLTLSPNGQHCIITAKEDGYARVKVTHNKASHPYYFGVYVFADISKTTYITTSTNIVTLKADAEKTISVSLQNPPSSNYQSGFQWEVLNTDGSQADSLSITANGAEAVLRGLKSGQATVRVTHPDAGQYPLDIIVRTVEIVENVYIEPSETVAIVDGSTEKTITASLIGLKEGSQYSPDDFVFEVPQNDVIDGYSHANNFYITGLKNGSVTVTISHPKAATKREVLIITQNQSGGAVDASIYITTSQNLVKTKVGASETALNIILKGGDTGDEKDFTWKVDHSPTEGSGNVINVETTHGTVSSRAAAQTVAAGLAHITPLKEGTATITISHPKAYYTTEILVKVLPANAVLEEQLYFTGSGIVRFLNSESYTYTVGLAGANSSDENGIQWSADKSTLNIAANGKEAILTSTGTGSLVTNMTISHPKAESSKKVLVLTADTEEELAAMKAFYSDKMYHSVNVDDTTQLYVSDIGFGSVDEESGDFIEEDFSTISWTSNKPDIAIVEKSDANPLVGVVTGKRSGTAEITASYQNVSITFTVTVYPVGVDIGKVENTAYMTTSNNVVVMQPSSTKTVSITAIGLTASQQNSINWESNDTDVATVVANGQNATITSHKEGEAVITVSHPASENQLKINVRVGSEYVTDTRPITYISASSDVVTMTKDTLRHQLTAFLVNGPEVDKSSGFIFQVDKPSIVTIETQYASGTVFLKPTGLGIAELTISHPDAVADKKVLLVVGNTAEELAGFKYLSTAQNVVTIAEGSTKTLGVTVENTDQVLIDGFSWSSDAPAIAGIGISSSSTAIITGNSEGTTRIVVRHQDCDYPLEIIVQVVDKSILAANPFIQPGQNVLTLLESSSWTTVTAELMGGSSSDSADMVWSSSDSSVIQVVGQNGEGRIRGIKEGMAYVTISHKKAAYEAQILVIVSPASAANYSISVGESIIQMKPNGNSKTISATLVNGDTADKYNFRWSLDNYDVVDISSTANTAIITPKQQGQVTLTVSHPKSAYDQQIIIKVSEYTQFSFGSTSKILTEGKTTFMNMQVPVTAVKCHVEYESTSPLVATAQGTSSVCQLTALKPGTTTIKAKLVATATNVVQATADLLVSVEEGSANLVYITAPTTIHTMERGTNKTLSATLTGSGVIATDQQNLKWESADPNIVTIRGASTTGIVTGQSAYIEAVKAGETTITVSHDKSDTSLVFYIIVPGEEEKTISFNKTYIIIEKGQGVDLTSSISGGKTEDYNTITWTADKVNGENIVRLLGTGKTVQVYGLAAGVSTVRAQLPNGKYATCDIEVQDSKTFSFGTTTVRVQPTKTVDVPYTVSPASAGLQWVQNDNTYVTFQDMGNDEGQGTVSITGVKEGNSTLSCVTSYGSKATLQVICAWDYSFTVNKTKLQGLPNQSYEIKFTCNPKDSDITVDETTLADIIVENNGDGTGIIRVTPKKEGKDTITITATNPTTKEQYTSKNIALDFKYDQITIIPSIISQDGSFSRYDVNSGMLIIGDGESLNLGFGIEEKGVEYSITNVSIMPTDNSRLITVSQNDSGTSQNGQLSSLYSVTHTQDTIDQQYRIVTGYVPQYYTGEYVQNFCPDVSSGGICTHSDHGGTLQNGVWTDASLSNFRWTAETDSWTEWFATKINDYVYLGYNNVTSFWIDENTYSKLGKFHSLKYVLIWSDCGENGDLGGFFTRRRETSLDGKILSQNEFESIAWYYSPGVSCTSGNNTITAPKGILTQHIDAVKEPSTDTSILSTNQTDILKITVRRSIDGVGTIDKDFSIPIYTETRGCVYNYK